jgi:peroxiredoxin
MTQFESLKDRIRGAGADLLYVAAEKREGFFKPEKYLLEHPVSFPFLLDEDRSVTKAFGLYHRMGMDAFNIAHPATLVLDRGGVIRFIYRGDGQADRAPTEQILDVLGNMQRSG